MAIQYSIQKMVSDGTLSTVVLGIQYLERNDIYIRIAGVETPQSGAPSGYTWSFIDNTTLKIMPVVPTGVEVVIYRRTDINAMYNIYSQNAQFDEATIDENNQQLLYIAQEYLEQGIPGAGVDTIEFLRDDGSFTYYRIKRTDGSYSDEFAVPSTSTLIRVLVREALRRIYSEAGLNLVAGSFESGGVLSSVNDVLLQEASGKAYGWSGPFPKVVSAGSGIIGYTDQSASTLKNNLAVVGSTVVIGGVTAGELVTKYHTPNPIDAGVGAGVFVESLLVGDAAVLHSMGVNYVVYLYHPSLIGTTKALTDIQELNTYGIGVVFSLFGTESTGDITTLVNMIKNEPNILAWYLYDEPDGSGITVTTQETKIGLVNTLSGLPVAVSASSDFATDRRVSKMYDYYFISRYISEVDYLTKADAALDLFFMLNFRNIGADVGIKRCIPVLQAYEQGAVKVLTRENMLRIWKKASKYYQSGVCFFLYSANATQPGGFPKMLANDSSLRSTAKTKIDINRKLNSHPELCAKSMFIAQDGVPFSSVDSTLSDAISIFDIAKGSGNYGLNTVIPNAPALAGYYPNFNGWTVVDLGVKATKLSIRFVARNDRDAQQVNVEIGEYYTAGGGKVLKNITGTTNVTSVTAELHGLSSRFIYIKLKNPGFSSTHNGYLSVVGVQFAAAV